MRVRRIVDLSLPVGPGTQVFPGDPPVTRARHATLERDGFNLLALGLGSQTGTHVDAPFHVAADGAPVDALDLGLFVGTGVVLDVRGRHDRARLTWDDLGPARDRLGPGTIALLHTGWSAWYGTARYFAHPFLDADACARVLDTGVRTICLDAPSLDAPGFDAPGLVAPGLDAAGLDATSPDAPGPDLPAHRLVAAAGGVIGENLRGLVAVDWPDPLVAVLPIRLEGADGAPVRAVAMELVP